MVARRVNTRVRSGAVNNRSRVAEMFGSFNASSSLEDFR